MALGGHGGNKLVYFRAAFPYFFSSKQRAQSWVRLADRFLAARERNARSLRAAASCHLIRAGWEFTRIHFALLGWREYFDRTDRSSWRRKRFFVKWLASVHVELRSGCPRGNPSGIGVRPPRLPVLTTSSCAAVRGGRCMLRRRQRGGEVAGTRQLSCRGGGELQGLTWREGRGRALSFGRLAARLFLSRRHEQDVKARGAV